MRIKNRLKKEYRKNKKRYSINRRKTVFKKSVGYIFTLFTFNF